MSEPVMSKEKLEKLNNILHDENVMEEEVKIESWEDVDDLIQNVDFRIERMSKDCIWVCLYQPDGKDICINFFSTDEGIELDIHDQ